MIGSFVDQKPFGPHRSKGFKNQEYYGIITV